jgi:RNA polymerase sigma-70 factor (ECF subfamily)
VAVLARATGDLSLAEEAVQDAFTAALEHWPRTGIPPAPAGWIVTTARRRAIDRLRREATRDVRHAAAMELLEQQGDTVEHDVPDERLRLIFTCCHPALSVEAQLALTLRLLGGLDTAAIARAFLVPEPTLAQRLTRAKAKVREAGIPLRIPDEEEWPARLAAVLGVVYLMFNEGYSAASGEELLRADLCEEAIRLARLLDAQLPREPEVEGLLALMLLTDARRAARTDASGRFVKLADQDRGRWNTGQMNEGLARVRRCLARNEPGPYQIQAAINAVHADATDAASTDWRQIVALYDQLLAVAPSPVVALNRAVAVAQLEGAHAALALLDPLPLHRYHLFHAVRADLLRRAGDSAAAAAAYRQAMDLCTNAREREHLERELRHVRQ